MTKKQFEKYKNEYTYCETCKRMLPTKYFQHKYIKENGSAIRCRYCEWINNHNGIPSIDGFTKEQVCFAIEFLIFQKSVYVNDLADLLSICLDEAISLVQILKIGNRKCDVLSQCDNCKKSISNPISVYVKNKHLYCSQKCYWEHKAKIIERGKNSPYYNRIVTTCTNCGKPIEVIPYDYKKTNSFGDNHNFCSHECYWNYRKQYYIAEKSVSHNRIITDEQREKMRNIIIENSRKCTRFDSKIQLIINSILDEYNINYEREFIIKYYAIDNYLVDSGLMIEVMGDYWHTSPLKYNQFKYNISELQQNGLLHDKQKHSYIKNHYNVEILYLWESDIENNLDMCKKLILKYIENNGRLENYHSFNWGLIDDDLILNKNLIIPYQDMKTDEYRHLIIKKTG